jgi:hydrogenase maturation protease
MKQPTVELKAAWIREPRNIVLGLGNYILRDDGVGIHALHSFQENYPRPCLALELGTQADESIHLIENTDRILALMAIEAGGRPGSVYALCAEHLMTNGKHSSLPELDFIRVLRSLRKPPSEAVIIAAEPLMIEWGIDLTATLESAVPVMVAAAEKIVTEWSRSQSVLRPMDLVSVLGDLKHDIQFRTSDLRPRILSNAG